MSQHTLTCRMSANDYAEAYIDSDGDVRLAMNGSSGHVHIYARPEDFARFACNVLTGTGESIEPAGDEPIRIGDRVEILPSVDNHTTAGRVGVVKRIDTDDIPYQVLDDDGRFVAWASTVRRIGASPATSSRASFVDQARKALDGTNPTAGDIIRLAEFLAAE